MNCPSPFLWDPAGQWDVSGEGAGGLGPLGLWGGGWGGRHDLYRAELINFITRAMEFFLTPQGEGIRCWIPEG